jgi:hypothetical protein
MMHSFMRINTVYLSEIKSQSRKHHFLLSWENNIGNVSKYLNISIKSKKCIKQFLIKTVGF